MRVNLDGPAVRVRRGIHVEAEGGGQHRAARWIEQRIWRIRRISSGVEFLKVSVVLGLGGPVSACVVDNERRIDGNQAVVAGEWADGVDDAGVVLRDAHVE